MGLLVFVYYQFYNNYTPDGVTGSILSNSIIIAPLMGFIYY